MEIFKDIDWYEGLYYISNKKRVYSSYWMWMILKCSYSFPYKVQLYKDGTKREFSTVKLYNNAFHIKEEIKEVEFSTDENILFRYWIQLEEICNKHSLLLKEEILSQRRCKYIQQCRYECYKYLRSMGITYQNIWKAFWKNHTAIMYTLKIYWNKEHIKSNCKV